MRRMIDKSQRGSVSWNRAGLAVVTAMLAGLASGACGKEKIPEPPMPKPQHAWVDNLPAVPLSNVAAPVTFDMTSGLAMVDTLVPAVIGNIEDKIQVNDKLAIAFQVRRDPFKIAIANRSATLTATFDYQGRGWYKAPVVGTVSASCGTGKDDPRPRAKIVVRSTVQVTPEWRLNPHTQVVEVAALTDTKRDQCKVTKAHVDVTEKVMAAVKGVLQKQLPKLDQQMRDVDLPGLMNGIWHGVLQKPIRIQDSIWFLIDPRAARLGPLSFDGNILRTTAGITAAPRIVTGPRPPDIDTPIPPLSDSVIPGGLEAMAEGRMNYPVMSQILQKAMGNKPIPVGPRKANIEDVRVLPVGDGRVALRVKIGGRVSGIVYLVGTPQFDSTTNELFMPDLALDVGSKNVLVSGLAWLSGGQLEDYIRSNVRVNLSKVIQKGVDEVKKQLNRELVPGILRLQADIKEARVVGLAAAPEALIARAVVLGDVQMLVTLTPDKLAQMAGKGEPPAKAEKPKPGP